jgi:hypothetical protein
MQGINEEPRVIIEITAGLRLKFIYLKSAILPTRRLWWATVQPGAKAL